MCICTQTHTDTDGMDLDVLCLVAQLCPILCDPVDCSPPGSSVHGDSPGKNTRVGCLFLLQGVLPTQGSNLGLLHCRHIVYHLSLQGSPQTYINGHKNTVVTYEDTYLSMATEISSHCKHMHLRLVRHLPNDAVIQPSVTIAELHKSGMNTHAFRSLET